MALTQRLELRQGQALVMTPQLQQAIKLLQLSNLELAEYVEQELEKNPLLERDEREPTENREPQDEQAPQNHDEPLEATLAREDFNKADEMDAERDELYTDEVPAAPPALVAGWTASRIGAPLDSDENSIERTLSQRRTLKDHLLDQLSAAALAPEQRLIGAALIDAIDEAGYLHCEISELAEQLGASHEAVCDVLIIVQGFDPTGVGARD